MTNEEKINIQSPIQFKSSAKCLAYYLAQYQVTRTIIRQTSSLYFESKVWRMKKSLQKNLKSHEKSLQEERRLDPRLYLRSINYLLWHLGEERSSTCICREQGLGQGTNLDHQTETLYPLHQAYLSTISPKLLVKCLEESRKRSWQSSFSLRNAFYLWDLGV